MSTEGLKSKPALLPRVLADRLWGERDLFVIDVGASGGIGRYWTSFGDRLRAVGFDPLLAEVERLQSLSRDTKVSYEAAFVTCRDFDSLFPPDVRNDRIRSKNNDAFQRVSAMKAHELLSLDYVAEVFNSGAPAVYTDRQVVLDDYVQAHDRESVDFIKIDTDGHDFQVLLGADALISAGGVLGFSIEAQFHGSSHDHANTFANIDRFLRARGFSLFDLESYRYSRSTLPAPFVYDIPAQTLSGQVMWGEAVYFRDLAMPEYEQMWQYAVTTERVVKLACLYDLFGLPDCAAELLVARQSLVGEPVRALLDDLAAPSSYDDYIRRFRADPRALYPTNRKAAARAAGEALAVAQSPEPELPPQSDAVELPPQSNAAEQAEASPQPNGPASMEQLRRLVERQQKKIADLQERSRRHSERIDKLKNAMKTAGLRP